jgi:hypothetical protein
VIVALPAAGNTTQIGILLLGSAALSTGSLAAAAQSLSGSVVAAALSEDALQQAYPQAISQALQAATSERSYLISPDATAILAAASVSAKQASAISQSFAQVCCAPLVFPFSIFILPFCLSILPFGFSSLRASSPVMHPLFLSSHCSMLQFCATSYCIQYHLLCYIILPT